MSYYDSAEDCPSTDRLRELLVGKSIVSATTVDEKQYEWSTPTTHGVLTMSDGTALNVWGNQGCGGCPSGWYELAALNGADGVITNVEVDANPDEETCSQCKAEGREWNYECPHHGWYRIFVVAADKRTMLASFEGTDGNGYYGTGWWMRVEVAA